MTCSLLDLQLLLNSIINAEESLSSLQLALLEQATQKMSCCIDSDHINHTNQIWLALSSSPLFWQNISFIVVNTACEQTKVLGVSSIRKRVQQEWNILAEEFKESIKKYVIDLINQCLSRQQQQSNKNQLLTVANDTLVEILKQQGQSLVQDFISHFHDEIKQMNISTILNNLHILQLVMEEGYEVWQVQMTSDQLIHFRSNIEGSMRNIIAIINHCLSLKNQHYITLIQKSLDILTISLPLMPIYEVFNSELIDTLQKLIPINHFQSSLLKSFDNLFNFKEDSRLLINYSNTARKLMEVLESYLKNIQTQIQIKQEQKHSVSTKSSFQIQKIKIPSRFDHFMLLLNSYLKKFNPVIQQNLKDRLEVEFENERKTIYAKDICSSYSQFYSRVISYLKQFMLIYCKNNLKQPLLQEQIQQKNQNEIKLLETIKQMMIMMNKIKSRTEEEIMQDLLPSIIVYLTPYDQQLQKYYEQFGLLKESEEVKDNIYVTFNEEYHIIFSDIMKIVLNNKIWCQIYFQFLNKSCDILLDFNLNNQHRKKSNSQRLLVLDQYECINQINRITWNIIISSNVEPSSFKNEGTIKKIMGEYVRQIVAVSHPLLKKCLSVNSKILFLANSSFSSSLQTLFQSLINTQSDLVIQFLVVLISKIFQKSCLSAKEITKDQICIFVQKVKVIESFNSMDELFLKVYEGLFELILKRLNLCDQQQSFKALAKFVNKLIEDCLAIPKAIHDRFIQKQNMTYPCEEINYLLLKLQTISNYLIGIRKSNEQSGSFIWLLTNHIKIMTEQIKFFSFRYYQYSQIIINQKMESFEINKINQFRSSFITLATYFIKLLNVRLDIDEKYAHRNSNYIHKETITHIKNMIERDLLAQKDYKCIQSLDYLNHYIIFLFYSQSQKRVEEMNHIFSIVESNLMKDSLHHYQLSLYKFIESISKNYLLELNDKNVYSIVKNLRILTNQPISQFIQISLDIHRSLINQLIKVAKKDTVVWKYFISLTQIIFEQLFAEYPQSIQKQYFHIFYEYIRISIIAEIPFDPSFCKKTNFETLYIYLKKHIDDQVTFANPEEHEQKFQRFYKEKEQQFFNRNLKDYIIYVNRQAKKYTQ